MGVMRCQNCPGKVWSRTGLKAIAPILILSMVGRSLQLNGQMSWTTDLPTIGSFSSPRVTDLNADGIMDIVMGAGREEFNSCDSAVIALDGRDGHMLWHVRAKDQIFGSAIFLDINGDLVDDVVIGGRSAELIAIDGKSGQLLWRFMEVNDSPVFLTHRWFNFYNPQWIPDQDQDGLSDLLLANGGDVLVEPYDPNRAPGYLVIVSARTGKLLKLAPMPDGKEIYMSPVLSNGPAGQEVVFGTGGETIGGSLYADSLVHVCTESLDRAVRLKSGKNSGFIGPVSCADLNQDGISDILVNAAEGRLIAIDGLTKKNIWELDIPNSTSYTSPCIGYFNADEVPDVFKTYGQGTWPKLDWSLQRMVDGNSGQVLFSDSLGYYQIASPLAVDLNNDGIDEVIMSINYQEVGTLFQKYFYTTLMMIDFRSNQIQQIGESYQGSNFASTPWAGDLDGDGYLDIIFCHGTNLRHTYTFDGMQIHRISTHFPISQPPHWGSYQGTNYDGRLKGRQPGH